jgi:hypothetical protein
MLLEVTNNRFNMHVRKAKHSNGPLYIKVAVEQRQCSKRSSLHAVKHLFDVRSHTLRKEQRHALLKRAACLYCEFLRLSNGV